MSGERGQVRVGSTQIEYRVERSERRRTVLLQVRWQDGVTIKSPRETPPERLEQIVRDKAGWLLARLNRASSCEPPPSRREFVAGESYRFLGRHYRLKLVDAGAPGAIEVARRGAYLEATAPQPWRGATFAEGMRAALVGWYQEQGQTRLPERVEVYAVRAGAKPAKTHVLELGKRWGSCNQRRGELRFNWRLMMAPLSLVDYVVAHEVCHLHEPDHSPAFWRQLRVVLPDYEERRERLRRQGPMFDL